MKNWIKNSIISLGAISVLGLGSMAVSSVMSVSGEDGVTIEQYNELVQKVEEMTTTITSLNSEIDTLKSNETADDQRVAEIETKTNNNSTEIINVKNSVASVKTSVDSSITRISKIEIREDKLYELFKSRISDVWIYNTMTKFKAEQ